VAGTSLETVSVKGRLVTGDVRQVQVDDGAVECWERETGDQARRVAAEHIDLAPGPNAPAEVRGWNVHVAVMEFIRKEPLEGELRSRIAAALRSVEGVETADEMDTEVWWVTGTPAGPALVQAVAEVLDDLADQTRAYIER
jgi:hypothetical protein